MSVLVTGGAGYIGAHMVWRLIDAGETVVVLDNLSTGFDWAVPAQASLVKGSSGDGEQVSRVIQDNGVDAIIHCAGSWSVPESVGDPLLYYQNNTVGSHALIKAAVENGVKHFIFSSTAAVYGGAGEEPVTEDAEKAPESPYGRSKLMVEAMLSDASSAYGLRYAALRYFNVAGADPQGRSGESTRASTHLIKVAAETAVGLRQSITLYGTDYPTPDGTCVRDYIHVSDLVDAHARALAHLRSGGGDLVANCGYGIGFSVREVLQTVCTISGKKLKIIEAPRRPGDPAAIVASPAFLMKQLGWRPQYNDLDVIVRTALSWEAKLVQVRPG